jgi:hypothetical protein
MGVRKLIQKQKINPANGQPFWQILTASGPDGREFRNRHGGADDARQVFLKEPGKDLDARQATLIRRARLAIPDARGEAASEGERSA